MSDSSWSNGMAAINSWGIAYLIMCTESKLNFNSLVEWLDEHAKKSNGDKLCGDVPLGGCYDKSKGVEAETLLLPSCQKFM
jgi:hypothetical protein